MQGPVVDPRSAAGSPQRSVQGPVVDPRSATAPPQTASSPSRPETPVSRRRTDPGRTATAPVPAPPLAQARRPDRAETQDAVRDSPVTRPALPYTPLRSQPLERGTVGNGASARLARTEQPGVLSQDRSGFRPGPPRSLPQQDAGSGGTRRSGQAPAALDASSSDSTIRAADLAARIRGTQSAAPTTGGAVAGGGSLSGNGVGSAPPNRGQSGGSSSGGANRGGARATGGASRSATPHISMQSEMIRRAPADEPNEAPDQPAVDVDAIVDEVERRLQRRLRLGFDRRGGLRGGGPSWPM